MPVPLESLQETVTTVFAKMGVPPDDPAQGADTLVMTDVRGVETHGVSNMLRAYVNDYRTGKLNPKREWGIVKETQATAVVYGPTYIRIAVEKARQAGTGLLSLFNVNMDASEHREMT